MVSKVYVVGVGMGNPQTLTHEAHEALEQSALIVGAARLLEGLSAYEARKEALVGATKLSDALRASDADVASVVMSGDIGFYSGATSLYAALEELGCAVHTIPGISSLAYVCARLHVPWQDVHVVSAHGRTCDVAGAVQSHERTFVLAGGANSIQALCAQLVRRGLGAVEVAVGERLSYANERIVRGSAAELAQAAFESLAVMLVTNKRAACPTVAAPHVPDSAFVRGNVPMTKEEVRALVVCKLQVRPSDVVWDVGAGTGSVSVELAHAAYAGQVLAIEKNAVACELIQKNKEVFGLDHLRVVEGEAPDALGELPAPDRVFVGGSTGRLVSILQVVRAANPAARVCVSAITLETLSDVLACVRELGLVDADIAQVSVSKAHEAGSYHLMRAQNPVYLATFTLG